jgi:predicted phosphodiesterase
MQIAVISDLHLGAGGKADGFGHDDAQFLQFLNHLEGSFEKVVLLGDVWETLTGHYPGSARAALKAARNAHPEIARRFEQSNYHYVHGNHDLVAGRAENVPDELVIDDGGTRLWFTHGHQGDLLVKHARWVSELGVFIGGWLRRLHLDFLYQTFDSFSLLRDDTMLENGNEACRIQSWAVAGARARNADVVITGHTHVPKREEHGSQLFLNSGSCSGGEFSFLAMDTKAAQYSCQTTW